MKKHEKELIDLYKKLESQIEAAIDSGKNNRSSMFHKQLIVKIDNIFKEHDVKVDEWTKSSVESIYNDSTKAQKRNLKKSTEKSDDKESSKMSQEEKDKLDKDSIDEIAKGKTSQLRYANSSLQKNIKNSIKKNAKEKGRRQKEIADSLKEDIYSKDGDGGFQRFSSEKRKSPNADFKRKSARISIKCKDGKVRNYEPEKYAQVVAQQAEIEAKSTAAENEAKKMGTQIMAMSSHSPTCKICATLQGRWYSLDKKNKDFPYIYDTAWKNGKVIHPGCRHTFKAIDMDEVDEKTLAEKKKLSNRAFELSDEDEKMLKKYFDDQKKKAKITRDTNSYNELVNTIGKDNLPSLEEFVKIKEEGGEEWDRIKELERQAEGEKLEAGSDKQKKVDNSKLDSDGVENQEEADDEVKIDSEKHTHELLKQSKCSTSELGNYLRKVDGYSGTNYADEYKSSGKWPEDIQIPKDSSVLKSDGNIDWSQVPNDGFVLDSEGSAIKETYIPPKDEIIDRYGSEYGRFTSPLNDGEPYSYEQRSLPYLEDRSKYHKYRVSGDFSNIKNIIENHPNSTLRKDIKDFMEYKNLTYDRLTVYRGKIASGFGVTGGGIQYQLPLPVNILIELKLLELMD